MKVFKAKTSYSSKLDSYSRKCRAQRNWFLAFTRVEPNLTRVTAELLDQNLELINHTMCPEYMKSKVTRLKKKITRARPMSRVPLADKVTRVWIEFTRVNMA